jgi:xanthine dehydrogenase accessory factor
MSTNHYFHIDYRINSCLSGNQSYRVISGEEAMADPEHYCSKAVLVKGEPLEYYEPLMRAGRVFIFGGGHVGQALVPVLASVDFRVTVYDKRKELATAEHFPMAENVIFGDYEHIFDKITLKPSDYGKLIQSCGNQNIKR